MKIKVGARTYPAPTRRLELGELRYVKREFGVIPGVDDLDLNDPDHVGAVLYAAMREDQPDATREALLARINRAREVEFIREDGDRLTDDPEDPTGPDTGPEDEAGK